MVHAASAAALVPSRSLHWLDTELEELEEMQDADIAVPTLV